MNSYTQMQDSLSIKRKNQLKSLIPEAFNADGGFDAEALQVAIGIETDREDKRFGLVWPGKADAARMVNAPHSFYLAPDRNQSVDFDTTKNAFIEADNLVALRLMQNAYQGQVKLIYIDPPYNTGNDFVYKDDFADTFEAYFSQTCVTDENGKRIVAKTTAESGRKHSNWLSFMYPRLVLARQMLRQDGAIMVACDDNEMANLRLMMNEIFGEENFVATMVWQGGRKNDSRFVSVGHDYMTIFAKDSQHLRDAISGWHVFKEGLDDIRAAVDTIVADVVANHRSDWTIATNMMKKWFKDLDDSNPAKSHAHYSHIDGHADRGHVFFPDNISWPGGGGPDYDVTHPITGMAVKVPSRGWVFQAPRLNEMISDDRVFFGDDETKVPNIKRYLRDTENWAMASVLYQDRRSASKRLKGLMGDAYFDFPKDETVIARIIEAMSGDGDIVMDFFGGSGSTGHAVWLQNAKDGMNRRFVLCTLPEIVNEKSTAAKHGYQVISQITRDRLRLAGEKIRKDNPDWTGDTGFRSFKLIGEKKTTRPATAEDLLTFFQTASSADVQADEIESMELHSVTRFAMQAGFRLDATFDHVADGIWLISQDDRSGWIAIPTKEGDLRKRLCEKGAKQDDEVVLVDRFASDSDMSNCSAFFNLTAKRF